MALFILSGSMIGRYYVLQSIKPDLKTSLEGSKLKIVHFKQLFNIHKLNSPFSLTQTYNFLIIFGEILTFIIINVSLSSKTCGFGIS